MKKLPVFIASTIGILIAGALLYRASVLGEMRSRLVGLKVMIERGCSYDSLFSTDIEIVTFYVNHKAVCDGSGQFSTRMKSLSEAINRVRRRENWIATHVSIGELTAFRGDKREEELMRGIWNACNEAIDSL